MPVTVAVKVTDVPYVAVLADGVRVTVGVPGSAVRTVGREVLASKSVLPR